MRSALNRRRGETTKSSSITPSNAASQPADANRSHGVCTRRYTQIYFIFVLAWYLYMRVPRYHFSHSTQQQQQQEGRLVVALSTIPSRIHLLQPTLESLIHQDLRPDTVYLTLAQKKAHTDTADTLLHYTIPSFIKEYQQQGLVTILSPEYDYGSITKVLYVLQKEEPDTRIIYVDDDWIYDVGMTSVLYHKSLHYGNHTALCLSGAVLRNYFRQVTHTEISRNHHPYIFMEQSGTDTLVGGVDHAVNIAQGFGGVLVQPSFFDYEDLLKLLQQPTLPTGVVKSDDFILSSHLQYKNISIMLVDGGVVPKLTKAASIDKLSLFMYRHAMEASHYLQDYYDIWRNYSFLNPATLSSEEWNAIDCEAGRGAEGACDSYQRTLQEMNKKYPPS